MQKESTEYLHVSFSAEYAVLDIQVSTTPHKYCFQSASYWATILAYVVSGLMYGVTSNDLFALPEYFSELAAS